LTGAFAPPDGLNCRLEWSLAHKTGDRVGRVGHFGSYGDSLMGFIRGASIVVIASTLALAGCAQRGEGGLFNRGAARTSGSADATIGVNAFLWRAALDTLSFLPLESADPWGGILNYGWVENPEAPGERVKTTVFILDTRLRADALNVTVTREVRNAEGNWVAAPVSPQTEADLKNAILTRARQLNLATINN
jgi:hypothetical protein